jgi:hypothetical protein
MGFGSAWLAIPPGGSGGCGGWWPVAVQGPGAVGAGRGDAAVGVQGDAPAPAVDGDQVVEGTQQDQVGQGGRAALGAGDDVVRLCDALSHVLSECVEGGWLMPGT